jgi:hypothetical protein
MNDTHTDANYWRDEVPRRLAIVRESLLDFLRLRTRLEWFKRKARWRLSRKQIWPGTGAEDRAALEEAVDGAAGVGAFQKHVLERQRTISDAIERYNRAVRRAMEEELGVPAREFDETAKEELRRRRITFQGMRDELHRLAREVGPDAGPELVPELLSLRIALLTEDVRDELFSGVAALVADERADADDDTSVERRELTALEIELRLRCLDRYHAARLLAQNYDEARRLMGFDEMLERYRQLARGEPDEVGLAKAAIIREVLLRNIGWLEEIFHNSAGTHTHEMLLLRRREG